VSADQTARTTTLIALAMMLRQQPTGARILQGLDELGEAVVQGDIAEAHSWVDGIALLAGLPTGSGADLTVYRAEHDSIRIGLYTTAEAARAHCEAYVSDEYAASVSILFDWIGDEDDPEEPWELVVQVDGGDEQPTGYVVTPLTVAAGYDPEAEG
jgi:hypothetical protein